MSSNEKYQKRYRITSARLPGYNYGSAGVYFITICTKNHTCFFGKIVDGKVFLNELGKIVRDEWLKTPIIRPDMNLSLGAFVVMPNHFHGILVMGGDGTGRDAMHRVSTTTTTSFNQFTPQSKNLASVVRGFKSAVTTCARKMGMKSFAWQPRFYDHIIRNIRSYEKIEQYIINNPLRWENDKYFR